MANQTIPSTDYDQSKQHQLSHLNKDISLNRTLLDKCANQSELNQSSLEGARGGSEDILFKWRIKRKLEEARQSEQSNLRYNKYFPLQGIIIWSHKPDYPSLEGGGSGGFSGIII